MIIVDEKLAQLEKAGKPIRVGMVGAGFMAQGIANQIVNYTKGMRLVAISNRTLSRAKTVYESAGAKKVKQISTSDELTSAIKTNMYAVTEDASLLIQNPQIDVIVEVTGNIDYGASIVMQTIQAGKHIVTMSAELDATIGPILKNYADKTGVVYTVADGDQPGVTQNLINFVKGIGVKLVLCGNIKGLHDPYRNPTTQEGFAKKWRQNPIMVTSFADGSKISFEQTVTANANGLTVAKRGMYGPTVADGTPVTEAHTWYPNEAFTHKTGIVDYVVGASPAPGIFVIGTTEDPQQKHYLNLYKLGEGPYYVFYAPYHLCHFEVANSIARAVLFHNATVVPLGGPIVEVVTVAKIDLKKGATIDDIGGYMTYGVCENHVIARRELLLPMGFAQGCVLTRDVKKDAVLTFDDVKISEDNYIYQLWKEQEKLFSKQSSLLVTIGIPTCYGGQSLVNTVRSIRDSIGGKSVRIIVVADRTPITKEVAQALKKMKTELYWNNKEGSQCKKNKQIIEKITTDLYISTQDDITFNSNTIHEIVHEFENDTTLTMAGIRIQPLPPETFFESAIGSMVRIVDTIARSWNGTDNHLASSGRCLAYRTKHIQKFRIPEGVVNSDMFFYLENKRLGGTFRQISKAFVSIRCPQTIKDQIAPSSRYLYSKEEMKGYFNQNLDAEYKIPLKHIVSAYIRELVMRPLPSLYYFLIRIYTLVKRLPKKTVANPVWRVDVSTKQGASSL